MFIFETRYKDMLKESLDGSRMFCVARQRLDKSEECPEQVAGIGLIRAAIDHDNGTSHLVLQGLARVILRGRGQYRTFPNYQIKIFNTRCENEDRVHALGDRAKSLAINVLEGNGQGAKEEIPVLTSCSKMATVTQSQDAGKQKLLEYLNYIDDPEQIGDLISSSIIHCPIRKQQLLSISSLEERLDLLSRSLIEEYNLDG